MDDMPDKQVEAIREMFPDFDEDQLREVKATLDDYCEILYRMFTRLDIGNIDWAKQIITTLEKSRNIIMHSGELEPKDIERVGTYIRDWIRQVG